MKQKKTKQKQEAETNFVRGAICQNDSQPPQYVRDSRR